MERLLMTQANLMKDKHVRVQEDSKVVKLQKANVGSLCEFKTALQDSFRVAAEADLGKL